jgi:hypothetical protein
MLQPQMVNTFGIVLANDTIWWLLLETYKYMNIWLGGVLWANFHKAKFSLYFPNQNILIIEKGFIEKGTWLNHHEHQVIGLNHQDDPIWLNHHMVLRLFLNQF